MIFKGIILDQDGNRIPDVHVYFPESVNTNGIPLGTTTNNLGEFTINSNSIINTSKVVISYIGKITINDIVSNLNFKSIVLKDNVGELDGVTVYGPKKKKCWWCWIVVTSISIYGINQI